MGACVGEASDGAGPRTGAPRRSTPFATSTSTIWREALQFVTPVPGTRAGRVVLRWRLVGPTLPEARQVVVVPEFGGVGRGPGRDDGWIDLPEMGPVRLTVGGPPAVVAAGSAPAGGYSRVFVAASSAHGAASGGSTSLTVHIEPIARGITVAPGTETVVDMDLIALRIAGGTTALFVKDAKVNLEGQGHDRP